MKKRFVTLMVVMGLCLSLVACGGSKSKEDESKKESALQASALVIEDENVQDAEEVKEEQEIEGEDDGEVLDGTENDNMMVEMEAEDWSDFTADTVLVDENEVKEEIITLDTEYYEVFRLDFNHAEEVAKIEFFKLLDQDKTANGDYSDENRSLLSSSEADDSDFAYAPTFIKYSVPEIIPNMIVRFTSYGGNVKEFVAQYNGRDGGAFLSDITPEFTR